MKNAVLADAQVRKRDVTYLPEEYLSFSRPDGAYLIACKLSDDRMNYHFAIQLSNGDWIDKPGTKESRYNKIDGYADIWEIDEYIYDSETIYFLYTP